MDKESLELLIGQGLSIERIAKCFGKDPSTISYWMKKHGLQSPYAAKHAAKGGVERGQLEELVGLGMTIAEIAEELGLSKGTVRHWLGRYGLRTKNGRGTREPGVTAAGKDAGKATLIRTCRHHRPAEFVIEGRGYYRCKRCRTEQVVPRRRAIKVALVSDSGGQCALCGYSRCMGALHFHHLEPVIKRLEVSKATSLSLERVQREVQKCLLLCSNCHAEVEEGLASLPLEF